LVGCTFIFVRINLIETPQLTPPLDTVDVAFTQLPAAQSRRYRQPLHVRSRLKHTNEFFARTSPLSD